ncbi:MAG: hypothetical protein M1819_002651 [Sarea resinae]|nr:MAG: hypothetical protein M1819_002651 [Sarea resinae]
MSGLLPVAVYGLEVPAGDIIIPAVEDFPVTLRITMAAIDPSAAPQADAAINGDTPIRATLKILRQPIGAEDDDDDSDESDEDDYLSKLLSGADSEDDESSDDDEKNGGPSDPAKSKKARKEAAVEALKKALAEEDDMSVDEDDEEGAAPKAKKGKAKATGEEEESSDDDEDADSEDLEIEEFVVCTLDPTKNYQQPLDLTIGEDERVFFKVTGTHAVYLTGNYVVPADDGHNHRHEVYDSDDDEDYDLSPDEDELDEWEEDSEDELDDLENPRVTEVDTDEEAPKLVKADKKGKNKRAAEESDEGANLDDIMSKSLKKPAAEEKLSKKQAKKLKNNSGEAVSAEEKKDSPATAKGDKKVKFAKNLEQGPTKTSKDKAEPAQVSEKPKAGGVRTVQGVKIEDKKAGKGPAAKAGDKVSMRYYGKTQDGKVFDVNKKGKPFTFNLGKGEVIKGWEIGVAGMSAGGERRLIIPPSLAYGNQSLPGIPKNSTLTFDIKLLEIK